MLEVWDNNKAISDELEYFGKNVMPKFLNKYSQLMIEKRNAKLIGVYAKSALICRSNNISSQVAQIVKF